MSLSKDARQIRRMFGAIAPRYDLLNHVLSLSIDKRWRRRTLKRLRPAVQTSRPILDLCTGTGDLALEMALLAPVVGCDFSHAMLVRASAKATHREAPVTLAEADALQLPFADDSFSAVTIAFGLRNLENCAAGLAEMHRVLAPSGALAVLEFSEPTMPLFRQLYLFYFRRLLPRIGALVSGDGAAYAYLPASVHEFPAPELLKKMMLECGFAEVRQERLSGGIAHLHIATKKRRA